MVEIIRKADIPVPELNTVKSGRIITFIKIRRQTFARVENADTVIIQMVRSEYGIDQILRILIRDDQIVVFPKQFRIFIFLRVESPLLVGECDPDRSFHQFSSSFSAKASAASVIWSML